MRIMVLGMLGLLVTGCATTNHVKVVQSKTEMTVKHIDIEDGDTLLCDPQGCRVLK
jgi:hypothetical protein